MMGAESMAVVLARHEALFAELWEAAGRPVNIEGDAALAEQLTARLRSVYGPGLTVSKHNVTKYRNRTGRKAFSRSVKGKAKPHVEETGLPAPSGAVSARVLAAIYLRIPDSGDPDVDRIIETANERRDGRQQGSLLDLAAAGNGGRV